MSAVCSDTSMEALIRHCFTALTMTRWSRQCAAATPPQSGSSPCRQAPVACVTANDGHFEHLL